MRIGCVKYLNALPLIHGWDGDVTLDSPAVLCRELAKGSLDVALVSSIEYLRNPIYRIVDGVSISSDGAVYSVVLAHREDLAKIEEIELDPASETSVNLLHYLLAQHRLTPRLAGNKTQSAGSEVPGSAGCQPAVAGSLPATISRSEDVSPASRQAAETDRLAACAPQTRARLLIGDQAIHFRQKHPEFAFWDLGEQWRRQTNLPFVYALWLVRPEVADAAAVGERLRALRDKNMRDIEELIARQKTVAPEFCRRYFLDYLRFTFGEREKQGLQRFADECAKQNLIPKRALTLDLV